jgi:hypothetical protein
MKALDARSGTSRPVQAAYMCRAIAFSGSSSKMLIALSISPSVQCATAQQLSCFAVFRSQRDHFAVTRRSFFGALQPIEQNAQVGIRVDVFRVRVVAADFVNFAISSGS